MTITAEAIEIEAVILDSGPSDVPIELTAHGAAVVAPSIHMTIIPGIATQQSLGSPGTNRVKYIGVAWFTIYTEGGNGSVEADGYAQTIQDIYRNNKLATVHCQIPYQQSRPQSGNHYSTDVLVPFHRDAFEA